MVEDRVEDLNSVVFFKYTFYDNVSNPNENSKIQDKKRLNKRTVETLLNELFVLYDQDTRQYASENSISIQQLTQERNKVKL